MQKQMKPNVQIRAVFLQTIKSHWNEQESRSNRFFCWFDLKDRKMWINSRNARCFVPKGPGNVGSDMISCPCELEWIPTLTSRFVRVIPASMTAMRHMGIVQSISYSSSKGLSFQFASFVNPLASMTVSSALLSEKLSNWKTKLNSKISGSWKNS